MKNVAPNARSFDSGSPFTVAAIACSRMPKCRFFPPGLSAWKSRALVRKGGPVRRSEIRRTAEEPGDVLREHVEHLARGVPAGHALRIGREDGKVAVPVGRQLAPLHQLDFVRECSILSPIGLEQVRPPTACRRAARAHPGREVLIDAGGDQEPGVLGPSIRALGETDLLLAERLAMG